MSGDRREGKGVTDHFSAVPPELVEEIFKRAAGVRPASELRPSEESKIGHEVLTYGEVSRYFENVVAGSPVLNRYSRTALAANFTKFAGEIYDYVIPWGDLPEFSTGKYVSAVAPLYKPLDEDRQYGFRSKILGVKPPYIQAGAIAAIAPFYGDMELEDRSALIDRSISILRGAKSLGTLKRSCEAVARGYKHFTLQEQERLESMLASSSIKRKAFDDSHSRSEAGPESAPAIAPGFTAEESPADISMLRASFNWIKGMYRDDPVGKLEAITLLSEQVGLQFPALSESRGKVSVDDRGSDRSRDRSANGR